MADRGADYLVNDAIKDYIFDLHQATRFSRIQSEVDGLYGAKFQELSKTYYGDKTAWPAPTVISGIANDDKLFLCFYKEMADRHLFSSGRPTAQDSVDAWDNYCTLFDLMAAGGDVALTLNEQWAFDVVHEFVYSFQAFAQYRADLGRRSAEDLEVLKANPGAWSVTGVAARLRAIVSSSKVEAALASHRAQGGRFADLELALAAAGCPCRLAFDLGYFALAGLSRLECLLGDYHAAVAVLAPIDLADSSAYFTKVFSCYLNLFYHAGVAYLMMRRYKDAVRVLGHVVGHVNRLAKTGSLFHVASTQADEQAAKKTAERCAILLSIAAALAPGVKVDDLVAVLPKDAARAYMERTAALEAATDGIDFETHFEKACPKFVSGAPPDFVLGSAEAGLSLVNSSQEPVRRQVELFGRQCAHHLGLAKARSFLKLYTAIEVAKLAKFQGASVDELRSELLAAKHLMDQPECGAGQASLDGARRSALDVHFYVEGGLIHIDDAPAGPSAAEARHESFFLEGIVAAAAVERQVRAAGARFEAEKLAAAAAPKKTFADDDDDYD